jgi:hypothetical protein
MNILKQTLDYWNFKLWDLFACLLASRRSRGPVGRDFEIVIWNFRKHPLFSILP